MKTRTLLLILLAVCLIAIAGLKYQEDMAQVPGKYTVWVGDSIMSTEHQTNHVGVADLTGLVGFVDINSGRAIAVPITQIYKVEINAAP